MCFNQSADVRCVILVGDVQDLGAAWLELDALVFDPLPRAGWKDDIFVLLTLHCPIAGTPPVIGSG